MATKITDLLTQVRRQLNEATPRFWSDAELTDIMRLGAVDLWGAILDLHQDHYLAINETDVVLRANDTKLSGVPTDCFRIQAIEPRDITSTGTGHAVLFLPRKYKDNDFTVARTQDAQDPASGMQIYYEITGVGAPDGAPTIVTAPRVSADLPVRLVYNPTLPWKAGASAGDGDVNPIPGESDHALKAWTIAFARAKETDGNQPDAGWLGIYATEKQTILTRLTPREEQEPEVVEDFFQGVGNFW